MLKLVSKAKYLIREVIPQKYQVPLKFYYNKLQAKLEPEMRLLKYLVSKGDKVIDVGGNRGVYAYALWKLGAKIEIFEPNPVCIDVLSPWVRAKKGVTLHKVGLSNSRATANLHIPIDSAGVEHDASATIENNNDFSDSRDQQVNIETLDSYQFNDINFIKIDVEGHEFKVLKGAESLLKDSRPALLIEIEQRHNSQDIKEIFNSVLMLGYEGYFLESETIYLIEKFDIKIHQQLANFDNVQKKYIYNFVFLHEDKIKNGCYDSFYKDFT